MKPKTYQRLRKIFSGKGIGNFKIMKKLNHMILKNGAKDFTIIDGHRMHLDKGDAANICMLGEYEPTETNFAKENIKEGNTVIDLGAHIGYFTLQFARLVGESGRVIAIEPDEENMKILKKNVEENGYKNVIFIRKAISEKEGKIKLFLNEKHHGNHSLYNSDERVNFYEVETLNLQDLIKKFNEEIDFIKMDIEGAEFIAVNQMSSFLKNKKNIKVIFEYCPLHLKDAGVSEKEFLDKVNSLGFKFKFVTKKGVVEDFVSVEELIKLFKKDFSWTNLLGVKDES